MHGIRPHSPALRPLAVLLTFLAAGCATPPQRDVSSELIAEKPSAPKLSTRLPAANVSDDEDWPWRSPGWRDEDKPDSFAGLGLYLGIKASYGQVLGDFDGDTAVVDDVAMPTEFVFIPDLDPSLGGGIEITNRWREWEWVLGYEIIDYDGKFLGASQDSKITYIDLNIRHYFNVTQALQPFLLIGFGWSDGEMDDGAFDGNTLAFGTGDLNSGVNYNFGGGVALYTRPWMSVWGQGMWRFGRYDDVGGPFGRSLTKRSIDADGWELSGGVSFRLLQPRKTRLDGQWK